MDEGSRLRQAANLIIFNLGVEGDDDEAAYGDDDQAWETLINTFKEVQLLLDHNHTLIQRANTNHASKIPRNMAENVPLICQINSNLAKVIRLYSNLSADFSAIVHQRRSMPDKNSKF